MHCRRLQAIRRLATVSVALTDDICHPVRATNDLRLRIFRAGAWSMQCSRDSRAEQSVRWTLHTAGRDAGKRLSLTVQ
jgi:hypothetical protein